MFIAKDGDLIVLAAETREELEAGLHQEFISIIYDSIEETQENYTLYNGQYLLAYEVEQKERERIAMLSLTAADVERAIYKAKGMDFDDVIAAVEAANEAAAISEDSTTSAIDIKALKIELKANNFYRGNPYIDAVGTLLGFTKEQLDEFFETNDYTKLLPNEDVHASNNVVGSDDEEETSQNDTQIPPPVSEEI